MARRVAPGQKADGNPQHDGAARSVRAIVSRNRFVLKRSGKTNPS
jgi:hypothetical protein